MVRPGGQLTESRQRPKKRFLEQVFGVGGVSGQPSKIAQHFSLVNIDELAKAANRAGRAGLAHLLVTTPHHGRCEIGESG